MRGLNKYETRTPGSGWRLVAIALGAFVTLGGLWVSGFSPHVWWASHQEQHQRVPVSAAGNPANNPIAAPISITPPAPRGNDSSISSALRPLVLVSTEPRRTLSESLAMLGVEAISPQTYVGGATLANGARITEIQTDYVVLSKNGRSARLYRQGSGHRITDHTELAAMLLNVGGVQTDPNSTEPTREVLTDYLRPSPVYVGDTMRGYQVYAGSRGGVFAQLGLQPGDVITSLNGVPLTDPASAAVMLSDLGHGSALSARVERKGATLEMKLDGSLIITAEQTVVSTTAVAPAMP